MRRAITTLGLILTSGALGLSSVQADCGSPGFDLEQYEKDADYYDQVGSHLTGIKSQSDIEKWMVCRDGKYVRQNYFTPPAKPGATRILDKVSGSFGMPKSLLTCVLFVESNYDPTRVSHKGAEGMGQTTQAALEQINAILKRKTFQQLSREQLRAKFDRRRANTRQERDTCRKKHKGKGDCDQYDADLEDIEAEEKVTTLETELAEEWRDHWRRYSRDPGHPWGEEIYFNVDAGARITPEVSIALTGMYFKYMSLLYDTGRDADLSDLTLLAGAYNAGASAGSKALCRGGQRASKAIRVLSESNSGARLYMGRVQTCMRSDCWGDFKGLDAANPGDDGKCDPEAKKECS